MINQDIREVSSYGPQPGQEVTESLPTAPGLPNFKVNVRLPDNHLPIRLQLAARFLEARLRDHSTYVSNKTFMVNEALSWADALLRLHSTPPEAI